MKIYELFGEWILEWPIVEQASKANEAQSKINSSAIDLIQHLVKIYKWHDEQNVKNHLSDISSWMYKISRVRVANNKRPTNEQYMQWVIKDVFSNVAELTTLITSMKKYQPLPIKHTDEQVYEILLSILEPFCKDLASGQFKDAYDYVERVD
jgi:hypothetical protein